MKYMNFSNIKLIQNQRRFEFRISNWYKSYGCASKFEKPLLTRFEIKGGQRYLSSIDIANMIKGNSLGDADRDALKNNKNF